MSVMPRFPTLADRGRVGRGGEKFFPEPISFFTLATFLRGTLPWHKKPLP